MESSELLPAQSIEEINQLKQQVKGLREALEELKHVIQSAIDNPDHTRIDHAPITYTSSLEYWIEDIDKVLSAISTPVGVDKCTHCDGSGCKDCDHGYAPPIPYQSETQTLCPECNGSGLNPKPKGIDIGCYTCKGSGTLTPEDGT